MRKGLSGFRGEANLYRLEPPYRWKDWVDEEEQEAEYVVVSAVVAMMSGPETYIFPATKDGKVRDWGELEGSYRGGMDHEHALRGMGYEVFK